MDTAAIRHIDDATQTVSVEGPLAWIGKQGRAQVGGENLKAFALGHQYHALLLYFDDIVADSDSQENVPFGGRQYPGRGGDYPYGGRIYLVDGDDGRLPRGLMLELPDAPPIEAGFSDWRDAGGSVAPFRVTIDDGSRTFDYAYSRVDVADQSPLWFFEKVAAPAIDEVQIHRLHRRLLMAHCVGDAELIAQLTAPELIVANRGELKRPTRASTRERFTSLFERLDYTAYHDLTPPVVEVAESGDMGWIAVNVRSVGREIDGPETFDMQWAWILLAKKIDGVWLNAGNASNWVP